MMSKAAHRARARCSTATARSTAFMSSARRRDGFCLYKSTDVTLNGCRSFGNLNGMINNGSGAVRVNGGEFSQNRAAGLAFVSAADLAGTEIILSPDVLENLRGAIAVAGRFDSSLS